MKPGNPIAYIDAHKVSEDERIRLIGNVAMTRGRAEFCVDGDTREKGKADRYMRKIRERFPRLREAQRTENSPVKHVTTVVVEVIKDS